MIALVGSAMTKAVTAALVSRKVGGPYLGEDRDAWCDGIEGRGFADDRRSIVVLIALW